MNGCRLVFDNSYFKYIKEQNDSELLVLETDDVLFKDEGFRWGQPLFLDSSCCRCDFVGVRVRASAFRCSHSMHYWQAYASEHSIEHPTCQCLSFSAVIAVLPA